MAQECDAEFVLLHLGLGSTAKHVMKTSRMKLSSRSASAKTVSNILLFDDCFITEIQNGIFYVYVNVTWKLPSNV
jgi:hypothetical protein